MATHYIGIDLGAESGRVMLGSLVDGRLALEELHRFANTPLRSGDSWHWDVPALWAGIKAGLHQVARRNVPVASVSVDSWGLDCVLLDAHGEVMPPVFHYRDPRTGRGVQTLFAKMSWEKVFAETGIQFMPINQLYHLAAESPERLARAAQIVPIGDLFNYFLSGVARAEVSMASTTQLYNPRTRTWSKPLLDALGLASEKFPPLVEPGTKLGRLKPQIASETGLSADVEVIATCTHDTGAAVAGVPVAADVRRRTGGAGADEVRLVTPAATPSWAYLSSGTWSLLGLELAEPILTDRCRELNFTNEIGFGNSVRLLKNIVGLWLVQECRREWAHAGRDLDYAALTQLAAEAEPFRSLINPADPRFLAPDAMPERIAAACRETGQPVPETPGQFIRCALESLALEYRRTLRQAEELAGTKVGRLHVVGGGSKNALLNQFAADACGLPVVAGPAEATAIGNILVQAIALGHLPSLAARARPSTRRTFTPRPPARLPASSAARPAIPGRTTASSEPGPQTALALTRMLFHSRPVKYVCLLLAAALPLASLRAQSDDALPILVQVLAATDDAQAQLDILKGLADGLKGRRGVKAPAGWDAVAAKLGKGGNAQVKELVQQLSLVFGSASALADMRKQLLDAKAPAAQRLAALEALVGAKDAGLADSLRQLLKEPALRGAALRGLAAYDDAKTPPAVLELLPALTPAEKRDALGTLASRLSFARPLVAALAAGKLAAKDLPADLVRQLRNYQQADLNAALDKHWGAARESTADKKAEMERYKALLAKSGALKDDLVKGRAVFAKTCGQCHQLYGVGGKVGPDITGSNRADLDYLLHNILDPNAEIPNDYRTWNLDTKDDRSVSGVMARQDATTVTVVTPNESLTIARTDIAKLKQSELSMMPEGLLQALPEDEVRNLIAYLRGKEQVRLPGEK